MIHPDAQIHPMACIDGAPSIGARTRVWQFASVIRGAVIGEDCSIASGACIDGSVIGDRCIIAHNLAMGPGFWVGNDCFIAPNVTFCNDARPNASKEGWRAEEFDGEKWAVIMEDGAVVGANAVILPGVRIGMGAMVAAGAVVNQDVKARHLYTRNNGQAPLGATNPESRMRFARETMAQRLELWRP